MDKGTNFADYANPYDFSNPINDRELFVGRASELSDIKYYLDHARKAPRPINLAILGERASGKTSMLNMIHKEAEARGFCVVRIDLDEADTDWALAFFYKLFDSLLTTVCSQGAYGGIIGRTYLVYRDMVDAGLNPDDKLFCPFVFPFQYSSAISANKHVASLSDAAFRLDLTKIKAEITKPIILLMDECDVLTKSRIQLEKPRRLSISSLKFSA